MRPLYKIFALIAIVLLSMSVLAQENDVRPIIVSGELVEWKLSPDGRYIATFENTALHMDEVFPEYLPIRVYDVESGEKVADLTGHADYPLDIAFSPDSTKLVSYHGAGYVHEWDIASGEHLQTLLVTPAAGRISFLGDNQTITILQSQPSAIQIWDLQSGAMTRLLMQRFATFKDFKDSFGGNLPDNASGFLASPDGTHIAMTTFYDNILLWDVATQEATMIYDSGKDLPRLSLRALDFSHDGTRLLYLDSDTDQVGIIDIASGKESETIPVEHEVGFALDLSPDGATVATLEWEPDDRENLNVVLTDVSSPHVVREISLSLLGTDLGAGAFERVAFTPESHVLVGGFHAPGDDDTPPGINAIFDITP